MGAQRYGGDGRFEKVSVTRGQRAVQVAAVGDHPGFIERGPKLNAVVELVEAHPGIVGKPLRNVAG